MSDQFTERLIGAIYFTLRERVKPSVKSSETLLYIDIVLRMLDFLKNRHSSLVTDMRRLIEEEADILEAVGSVFSDGIGGGDLFLDGKAPTVNPDIRTAIDKSRLSECSSVADFEAARYALDEAVCAVIPRLFEASAAGGEEASQLLERLIKANERFFLAQDPEIAKGMQVLYRGGRLDDEPGADASEPDPAEITAASMSGYLRGKFPQLPGVRAENIYIVPGGFSKLTIFFDMCADGQPSKRMAMRKDMPVSAIDTTVVDEYPLIEKVFRAGFPVPEPYWLERDARHFSGAFMVSARSEGSNDINVWKHDPAAREGFTRELARVMAKLHSLDLAELGFPREVVEKSAGKHLEAEIRKYYRIYSADSKAKHPLLDYIYCWLLDNIPKHLFERAPAIVHADIGFHNMLTKDGKITALLDWEMSHLGDPAEDLYYSKLFIDQVSSWSTFIGHYESFGGVDAPESEFFYYVWMGARNAAGCCKLQDIYESILDKELKVALPAYIFGRRLEVDASTKILDRGLQYGNRLNEH